MRSMVFILIAGMAITYSAAQSESRADNNVVLQVSIGSDQRAFHIGETIPLQLSFRSAIPNRYQVNMAQYDRSGRMEYEHFSVAPAEGAVDPLANRESGVGGGLTGFKFLDSDPWIIKLNLNEWVRFTQPGEYRITITSTRVGVKDSSNPMGASPVTVTGNDLTIKIDAASRSWQKTAFDHAIAALDRPVPVKPQEIQEDAKTRRDAMDVLRFLGTPEAIRELAKRMRGDDTGNFDYVCLLGLIGSPDPDLARQAMRQALADPDHPIDGNFLYALRTLETGDHGEHWREQQQSTVEELIAALPAKRGKALAVSLGTAVNEAWNGATLSKQTSEKLVQQLIAMFDQLPQQQQNMLLTYRWDKIAGPAVLPILRRYAQAYRDFPIMNESNAYESLQVSASALQHWYELDPEGARPAIIKEITRPRPRYGARVLGILPDKTLPEVDAALAEHLDYDGVGNVASLIARYASEGILSQVLEKLDPEIGKWACAIQDPLLAYVLRVSPGLARPRIEQAVAARGKDFSACNHGLFQSISEIHYDPVLEDIAVHSLNDPDPQVSMTAATMLGKFGSPAVESVLWDHYTQWTEKWQGRESELDSTFADPVNSRTWEIGLGGNLMQALVTGRSWLTEESKLQRLSQLTKVSRLRQQLDPYLKLWSDPPLTVSFNHNPSPLGLDARVAQYEYHSLVDLEDKLAQFPAGTKFVLSVPPLNSPDNEKSLTDLRRFITTHGMVVAGEKQAY